MTIMESTETTLQACCLTPTFGSTTSRAREILAQAHVQLRDSTAAASDLEWLQYQIADAAALIVGTNPVTPELLDAGPHLQVVAKHGAGVDNIDIEAATERHVVVTNAPGCNSYAVAEFTFGLLIAVARGIASRDAQIRSGEWNMKIGKGLAGATLGVVGFGAIGKLVAARAQAFGMEVVYTDIAPAAHDAEGLSARFLSMEKLLEVADFVTLHTPLTPSTRHLIDNAALERMKPSAFLINAARGGLVDEDALVDGLESGHIAGAALDVFAEEPLKRPELITQQERTVLTPHTAGYTDDALTATSILTAQNVVAAIEGGQPPNALNGPF